MKFLVLSFLLLAMSFTVHAEEDLIIYESESTLIPGKSDVAYDGQTTRQILIDGLKKKMGSLKVKGLFETGDEGAYEALKTYVDYKPEPVGEEVWQGFYGYSPLYFQTFKSTTGVLKVKSDFEYDASPEALDEDKLILEYIFSDSKANLRKKVAGVDNPLLHGKLYGFGESFVALPHSQEDDAVFKDKKYEQTPEEFLNYMMALWAEDAGSGVDFVATVGERKFERVTKAGVLKNGWDLTQLTQKFLHGALSFSQSARDYLSTDLGPTKGLNADNTLPARPGRAYTILAHHWDEAFGYFGASRDFLALTKKQIASKMAFDADDDNLIDVRSEANFGLSVNAAKRDLGSQNTENFTEEIFALFVEGRTLISKKPEGYRDQLKVVADKIIYEWERLFAANTIHYINKVISEYGRYNSENGMSFLQLAKFWGEMKGFALAFQFNPHSVMSLEDFQKLHELFRTEPVLNVERFNWYILNLEKARLQLAKAYKFDLEVSKSM